MPPNIDYVAESLAEVKAQLARLEQVNADLKMEVRRVAYTSTWDVTCGPATVLQAAVAGYKRRVEQLEVALQDAQVRGVAGIGPGEYAS